MKRKMIFLDLDDTLLSSDKTVSEENLSALDQALSQGHLVTIATGRSMGGARRIMRELGLDRKGCFLLAYQGSVIYDWGSDTILFSDGIDGETAAQLLLALEEAGICAHTFCENQMFTLHESKQLLRYNRIAREAYQVIEDVSCLKGRVCQKVIAVDYEDHERLAWFRKQYAPQERGRLNSFFSNRALLEYCKLGIHKGSGLKRLAALAGVAAEDTVAVGDEENDILMLQAAGTGVAMKNALPQVKAAADYVTKRDCDHSGVAEAVERFVIGK